VGWEAGFATSQPNSFSPLPFGRKGDSLTQASTLFASETEVNKKLFVFKII
jgi:hypothetical protein